MKVFGCQLDIAWENKAENFNRVRSLLLSRRLSRNSLVVLPEMFATGFSMNTGNIAEPADGATTRFLRQLAKDHQVYALGGLASCGLGGRFYNEAVCFAPSGRRVARYAKLHPFAPGGESEHYDGGEELALFRWAGFNVAIFVCYDLRFPEVFRMAAQRGGEAFVVIANWPDRRQSHWSTLLQARAIENQAYVIGVNRCGRDTQHSYAGGSVVIGPDGKTVASTGRNQSIVSARLDPSAPAERRRGFPTLKDIRTTFKLGKPRFHASRH